MRREYLSREPPALGRGFIDVESESVENIYHDMWEGSCDFTISFGDYSDGSILKVLSYEFSEAELQLIASSGALRDELAGSGAPARCTGQSKRTLCLRVGITAARINTITLGLSNQLESQQTKVEYTSQGNNLYCR